MINKDTNENSKIHNEIQALIASNPYDFFCKYHPGAKSSLKLSTEVPIITNNFIQGVADGILCWDSSMALIEVKSHLYDASGCIRQMKIYKEFILKDFRKYFNSNSDKPIRLDEFKMFLVTILKNTIEEKKLIDMIEAEGIIVIDSKYFLTTFGWVCQ